MSRIRTNEPRHVKSDVGYDTIRRNLSFLIDNKNRNFWSDYRTYLQRNGNSGTVNYGYNYSIRYCGYLLNPDTIGELLTFSPNKRIHIMKALSSLSKFCGCDDLWKQAIKRYNIKWSTGEGSLGF